MQSFLHSHCKAGMCEDCVSIAEEYQELEERRKQAMLEKEHRYEQMKKELDRANRKATMYVEVAKVGVGEIISAWMDKEINALLAESQPTPIPADNSDGQIIRVSCPRCHDINDVRCSNPNCR